MLRIRSEITVWSATERTQLELRYDRSVAALDKVAAFIDTWMDPDDVLLQIGIAAGGAWSGAVVGAAYGAEIGGYVGTTVGVVLGALAGAYVESQNQGQADYIDAAKSKLLVAKGNQLNAIDLAEANELARFATFVGGLGNPTVMQNDVFSYSYTNYGDMTSMTGMSMTTSSATITIDFQGRLNFATICSALKTYHPAVMPTQQAASVTKYAGSMIQELASTKGVRVKWAPTSVLGPEHWEPNSQTTNWPNWPVTVFGFDEWDLANELNSMGFKPGME